MDEDVLSVRVELGALEDNAVCCVSGPSHDVYFGALYMASEVLQGVFTYPAGTADEDAYHSSWKSGGDLGVGCLSVGYGDHSEMTKLIRSSRIVFVQTISSV